MPLVDARPGICRRAGLGNGSSHRRWRRWLRHDEGLGAVELWEVVVAAVVFVEEIDRPPLLRLVEAAPANEEQSDEGNGDSTNDASNNTACRSDALENGIPESDT